MVPVQLTHSPTLGGGQLCNFGLGERMLTLGVSISHDAGLPVVEDGEFVLVPHKLKTIQ